MIGKPTQERYREDEVAAEAVRRHKGMCARVFGSVARGTDQPDSDLDLLVKFSPGTSLFDLVDLTDELEAILGVKPEFRRW